MLGKSWWRFVLNGSNSLRNKKAIKNYKKLLTNKQGCGNIYSQGDNT